MNTLPNKHTITGVAALLTAGLLAVPTANAATITLTASDAFGTSSFNSSGKWSDHLAPSSGKDYSTAGFSLRTPADALDHPFAGDSLTVATGGSLQFKGTSSAATITVGNLILDGGTLGTLVTSDAHLAGGLSVTANGGTLNGQDHGLYVDSLVDGSGALSVIDSNGATNGSNTVFFTNGSNTYNGTITVATGGAFNLTSTGRLNFMIGADGVNNSVTGAGTTAFDGTFAFDLGGAAGSGSWTIVDTSTKSFAGSFTVTGWTDNADNTWSFGNYTFSETTGMLTAVAIPEPSSFGMLAGALAAGLVVLGRRRRNRQGM